MFRTLLLSLCLVTASVYTATAQPHSFTGSILYKIVYPENTGKPIVASLPQTIEMQISGNKAKFELTLPNGKYAFIFNGDETSVTRLIDASDGKLFVKKTKEDILKGEMPLTELLTETKTVAGQKCKAASVTTTDRTGKTQKSIVYYSEELGVNNINFSTNAKGIKGIVLETDYSAMGIVMHLTASEIKPGRVSNKVFEIPSGYTETTEAKLHQLKQANKKK